MNDRRELMANFPTEHYRVFIDSVEVEGITCGMWASLEEVYHTARKEVERGLEEHRSVSTGYLNTDRNEIRFWSSTKPDVWWTL